MANKISPGYKRSIKIIPLHWIFTGTNQHPDHPTPLLLEEKGPGDEVRDRASVSVSLEGIGSKVQDMKRVAMGEIIQNIHTFVLPQNHTYTLQMNFEYDSWNRPSAPLRATPTGS